MTDDQHWQHATGDCALNEITFNTINALGISYFARNFHFQLTDDTT